ncbi:MAG: phosphotransferase [Bacteroidota bacterium]
MDDQRLQLILNSMQCLSGWTSCEPVDGGLTNRNFRVSAKAGTFILRVSDPGTSLLGISRDHERINARRAAEAGVAPPLADTLPEQLAMATHWLEAKTIHPEDLFADHRLLDRMAAAMRTLHNAPAFEGRFYFPEVRRRYLETVQRNNWFLPHDYLELDLKVQQLESAIALNPEPFVPCNNDLLPENFLDDGNRIWIIDYEYAGMNHPSFELGHLASEAFLPDDLLTRLCDAYWQQHSSEKVARVKAWSIIARFGWTLWASIQEATSPIPFDYRGWGMKKYDSVVPEITGARFNEILTQLNP